MKFDYKQKVQLVVLCVLVVLVVAFGVYRVVGKGTQAAQKAPSPTITEKVSSDTSAQGPDESMDVAALVSGQGRDPFISQVKPKEVQNTAPKQIAQVTSRMPSPFVNQVSRLPFQIMPLGSTDAPSAVAPEQVIPDPTQELVLVGVIEGKSNIAIMRGSQGERYIVREGSSIDGKYRIESISRQGVRIRSANRIFLMQLGGKNGV
jgi:hypothetical protein